MTRILVADDHDVVRSGLRALLEMNSDWKVIAEAENGKEAVTRTLSDQPDVAIVDYWMPLMNGIEVVRHIKAHRPRTEVLLFTMHDSKSLFNEAYEAGARACLLKSEARQFLFPAIESLIAHQTFYCGIDSGRSTEAHAEKRSLLSPREKTVVQLVAEGHSNRSIGDLLNLGIKTVETHRAAAMRKLEIRSTAGLVRYAIRNKLVEP